MHHPARLPVGLGAIASAAMLFATACGPAQPAETPVGTDGTSTTGPTTTVAPPATPTSTTPAPVPGATVVTAEKIVAGLEPGEYQLDAFVLELRPCPECPPPLSCKPCLGDFIVVHDQAAPPANGATPTLRLKPDQIKQFEAGKRYRFTLRAVSLTGENTTNHIEVESASPLP